MQIRYHVPLGPDEQRAFGLAEPQTLAIADRVRFSEIDPNHHVNNKAYMSWFETVRVRYFDELCAPFYDGLEPPRLVLRSAEIRFIREMLRDEDYVATARATAFRTTSMTIDQQLWSGDMRARMTCVMVTMRPDGSARYPLPDALKAELASRDGAVSEA